MSDELQLVLVDWEDSVQAVPGWQWLDNIKGPSIVQVKSVGWLICKNEKELRLAVSVGGTSGEYQVSGVIAIPIRSILKITNIASRP